jgi:hypothetical protein
MVSPSSRPSARLAAQQVSKNAAKKMDDSPVVGSRRTSPNGGLVSSSQGETAKTTNATTRSRLQNRKQNSTEPVPPAALRGSGGQGQPAKERMASSDKFGLIPSCGSGGQGQPAKERTATSEKFALITSGTEAASSAGMGASSKRTKRISSGSPEEPFSNQEAIAQHGSAPAAARSTPVMADPDKTAPAVAVVASFPVRTLTAAKPPITEQPPKPSLEVPDTGGPGAAVAAAGFPVTSPAAATVAAQQQPVLALVGSPPLQVLRMGQPYAPTSNGELPANGGLQFSGKMAQAPAATISAVHQRVGLPVTNGGAKVAG